MNEYVENHSGVSYSLEETSFFKPWKFDLFIFLVN